MTLSPPRRPEPNRPDPGRAEPPQTAAPATPRRIVHTLSSLLGGGMEHVALRLAAAQRRRGHTVTLLALRDGPLRAEAARLNVPCLVLSGLPKPARVLRSLCLFARARPDIIHAHNPTSLQYAVLGKLVGHPKVLMTDHAQTRGIARVSTAFEERRTDAIVAVSHETARQHRSQIPPARMSVIHNGIDLPAGPDANRRESLRTELGLGEGAVGIMVAGMDQVKGHTYLLQAAARLKQRQVPVTVLIAGDGALRGALEEEAARLGIVPDAVRFLGFRADVPALLEAADFLLLPSLMEGLPISILEAMAHRRPVIATPVGGTPELVQDQKQGLLVPPQDPAALADAMERLAGDPALRRTLGEAGCARVRDHFSFDGMTAQYEALYEELIAARRTETRP